MTKHTPGPWSAPIADGHTTGIVWAQDPHGGPIASISRTVRNPDVAMTANALLIAAAPDMLAALDSARSRMADIGCCYGRDEDFTRVCDAIATARGETA